MKKKQLIFVIILLVLLLLCIPIILPAILPSLQNPKDGNTIEIESPDELYKILPEDNLFFNLRGADYDISFKGTIKNTKTDTDYNQIEDFYFINALVMIDGKAYIITNEPNETYDLNKYAQNRWIHQKSEDLYKHYAYDNTKILWTYFENTDEFYAVFNYAGSLYEVHTLGDCDEPSFLHFLEQFIN